MNQVNDGIAKRILKTCLKRGVPVEKAVRESGAGKFFMVNLERGIKPSFVRLAALAHYLEVTPEYLLGEDREAQSQLTRAREQQDYVRRYEHMSEPGSNIKNLDGIIKRVAEPIGSMVPVLDEIHAGVPIFCDRNYEDYIPSPREDTGDYFALRVFGDYMTGVGIVSGSVVTFRKQPFAENGQVVAVLDEDNRPYPRLYSLEGDKVIFAAANPQYDPLVIDAEAFEKGTAGIRILGVAVDVATNL